MKRTVLIIIGIVVPLGIILVLIYFAYERKKKLKETSTLKLKEFIKPENILRPENSKNVKTQKPFAFGRVVKDIDIACICDGVNVTIKAEIPNKETTRPLEVTGIYTTGTSEFLTVSLDGKTYIIPESLYDNLEFQYL